MSDRSVESLNEMKQIYLGSVSGLVISERDEYLQYIEEKNKKMEKGEGEKEEDDNEEEDDEEADADYDGDGEVESGEDEFLGSRHNAIRRAMGRTPDGDPPKKKKKKMDESFSDWRNELYERVGDVESDIESSKRQIKERSNIKNTVEINPNVNIGESVELSEEYIEDVIDVAAGYFYEQGLNEEGLQMVIEDLGVDKFLEYVFCVSEDLMLDEARTLTGKKTAPATGKQRGISLKAAPGKTTKAAVEKYGTTRRFSSTSPSGTVRKKVVKSKGDNAVEDAVNKQEPVTRRHRRHGKVVPGARPSTPKPQETPTKTSSPKGVEKVAGQVRDFVTSPETKKTLRTALSDVVKRGQRDLARTVLSGVEASKAAKKASKGGASRAGAAGAAAGTFLRGITRGVGRGGVREEIEAFLQEKAESEQQQKLFGLALSVKRGETPRSEVSKQVLEIVDGMSETEIRKFAKTKHKGLPKKKED
jgi:hypothetical protein